MKANKAVLLVNLGTPKAPTVGKVRKYLSQFLNDPRVIDINPVGRAVLVNGIIVPFRAPKSTKIYKELWTEEGSPLIIHGEKLKEKVQQQLGDEYVVELAMRYQEPSIPKVLEKIKSYNVKEILVLPLFPQYASSSTGSAIQAVMEVIKNWWVIPELKIVSQYFDRPDYIEAQAEAAAAYNHEDYDHVLFSYHGLPVRQVDKVYNEGLCSDHHCEDAYDRENQFCYKAACFETTRLIANRIGIPEEKYTIGFQSRLDKKWLTPFSDELVEEFAKKGHKKLLVFSPAFTADCLETTIEIGDEYDEIFKENGGEHLQLVPSLNSNPKWVDTVCNIIKERM
ncbi:ferrochelatase [Luteibaculum oceani]|uniref:Ferrochelatase n=1 Tax=Luteibaculum oceani TaxID=1294296 RepID=A0A5C6VAD3_9FLAO|nr:ferrochelatase [Luteibaculum oceani]TXC81774.1 ferrochelatase [Luteibaculum oceani]